MIYLEKYNILKIVATSNTTLIKKVYLDILIHKMLMLLIWYISFVYKNS